jgi:hypothetical protein
MVACLTMTAWCCTRTPAASACSNQWHQSPQVRNRTQPSNRLPWHDTACAAGDHATVYACKLAACQLDSLLGTAAVAGSAVNALVHLHCKHSAVALNHANTNSGYIYCSHCFCCCCC